MQLQIDFEIWVKILEGCYSISNYGNIKSHDRWVENHGFHKKYFSKGKNMRHFNNGNGYRYVTTSINGVRRNYYIHKLVAEAFIPNIENKPQVNHIDGIKSNNNVSNLEWCTAKFNNEHAIRTGLKKVGGDMVNAIKVINVKDKIIFGCIREVSDYYGVKYCNLKEFFNKGFNRPHKKELYKHLFKLDYYIETYPKEAQELGLSFKRLDK